MNPTNLRSSWELPSDLIQTYGSSKSGADIRKPLGEIDTNTNSEWNNLTHTYGKLTDVESHLPKFSDAEHASLVEVAVNNAITEQVRVLESKQIEWQTEREKLMNILTERDNQLSDCTTELSICQKDLLEVKQESAGFKVQTKALAIRVQVS